MLQTYIPDINKSLNNDLCQKLILSIYITINFVFSVVLLYFHLLCRHEYHKINKNFLKFFEQKAAILLMIDKNQYNQRKMKCWFASNP